MPAHLRLVNISEDVEEGKSTADPSLFWVLFPVLVLSLALYGTAHLIAVLCGISAWL